MGLLRFQLFRNAFLVNRPEKLEELVSWELALHTTITPTKCTFSHLKNISWNQHTKCGNFTEFLWKIFGTHWLRKFTLTNICQKFRESGESNIFAKEVPKELISWKKIWVKRERMNWFSTLMGASRSKIRNFHNAMQWWTIKSACTYEEFMLFLHNTVPVCHSVNCICILSITYFEPTNFFSSLNKIPFLSVCMTKVENIELRMGLQQRLSNRDS